MLPYWKHVPLDYLHDARLLKLSYADRGIYWQVINEMWAANMHLPDDDEYMSILLRIPIDEWIATKKRLMVGKIPLLLSQSGFLSSDKYRKLHENAEDYSIQQALKRAKSKAPKIRRIT